MIAGLIDTSIRQALKWLERQICRIRRSQVSINEVDKTSVVKPSTVQVAGSLALSSVHILEEAISDPPGGRRICNSSTYGGNCPSTTSVGFCIKRLGDPETLWYVFSKNEKKFGQHQISSAVTNCNTGWPTLSPVAGKKRRNSIEKFTCWAATYIFELESKCFRSSGEYHH